jgi:hypothetical protein
VAVLQPGGPTRVDSLYYGAELMIKELLELAAEA